MRASGYDRVENDWYQEPAWVVDALLKVEAFTGDVWDPACGGGNIPRAVERHGLTAFGSDIEDRGYGHVNHDFFTSPLQAHNIISNPPFDVIEPWIERALSRTASKVAILARLAFLEGIKRRDGLFKRAPLARVWVSSRRVSMPPGGKNIKAKGGAIAYGWFVFEHGHVGAPQLGWLP